MQLAVKNLRKIFTVHTRGGMQVHGFEQVNFQVSAGQCLSLFGPSGSGKSSILKTLFRTYIATSGSIIYSDGKAGNIDIATATNSEILALRKSGMSYVSQFLQVLPRISALDIVSEPLILKGESEAVAKKQAKELLDYLSIREELFDLSPLTFSGGEQQRVNIAKGIIAPKPLLLLDEPTASLDKTNTRKVIAKLKQLKAQGIAMVAIFHDTDAMDMLSDKIYQLKIANCGVN